MMFLQHTLILFVTLLINSSKTSTIESTTQSIYQRLAGEILKLGDDLTRDEEQLRIDRQKFEEAKQQAGKNVNNSDVFRLNIGGEIIMTTRETLTRIPKSILSAMFNGRWEHKLQIDHDGNIFFDFNPILFRHLLDQLQILDTNNNLIHFHSPSDSSLIIPFKKMIQKLGFTHLLSSEENNILSFNVGGQSIINKLTIFNQISNSTLNNIVSSSNKNNVFLDYHPKLFQYLVKQLREELFADTSSLEALSYVERFLFKNMLNDLGICRQISSVASINDNTIWMQNGITIAGGNGQGNRLNQLSNPRDTYVDDQRIYIADSNNHRIVEWECGAKNGEVVAGGNGQGNRIDQLNYPTSVIFDKNNDSFIICDQGNRRVIQWSRQNDTNAEIIISDIDCNSLATDKNGYLYVSDKEKHEVIIWKTGEINGTIVAGGNGQGNELNQLNYPSYIFVDQDNSLYVSEWNNYRVMKWTEGAEEGIIIIGLQYENILTRFFHPTGITVDPLGNVYVADCSNHRIIRWLKESEEISIVIGENEAGAQLNRFICFGGLSFDGEGNLYVTDYYNNRILKFDIDSN